MKIDDLPEIEFKVNLDDVITQRIKLYEDLYYEETGNKIVLEKDDERRVMIKASCLVEFQFKKLVEEKIKNNLLKYSRDEYLDNVEPVNVKRFLDTYSKVKIRLTVASNALERRIDAGKNVTPNGTIFFENKERIIIPANVTEVDAVFECTTAGVIGNGYMPGQITTFVDSVPEVLSLTNITESSGGLAKEDDDPYRQRKIEGNAGTSIAGPEDLYVALAKSYHVDISDVKVISENPGEVTVIILLKNGSLPSAEFMESLRIYMSAKDKRPMNDKVVVKAPTIVNYDLTLTYYSSAEQKSVVEAAIEAFIAYQKSVIGRDINPTTLGRYLTDAGAKRVEISLPSFTEIGELEVAVCNTKTINYGGDLDAA